VASVIYSGYAHCTRASLFKFRRKAVDRGVAITSEVLKSDMLRNWMLALQLANLLKERKIAIAVRQSIWEEKEDNPVITVWRLLARKGMMA
jgi:hypothetical protein